jgi:lactose/L-arabinose transport system permease protein
MPGIRHSLIPIIPEGINQMSHPKKISLYTKQNLVGWAFLTPAVVLIFVMSFIPIIRALILSFKTGIGARLTWAGTFNYVRMFQDKVFMQALKNNFTYLIIQVPIMLILALVLASMLNSRNLKFKGIFRTAIFLPCAMSLVSYATIFRALFSVDGLVNTVLIKLGILDIGYNFLTNATSARAVIIIALIWRWTGYNMVFYLSGLQNIEYSIYEAAKIDGASPFQIFWKITVPLLKPIILLTAIMSTNGTLQLFDESVNLTGGGPANGTITMSHYIYNISFKYVPNFGYAAAMAYLILALVAILSFFQMKIGDKRD